MSQDMLGAVVRSLVDVPHSFLASLGDLCDKLKGESGERWWEELKPFLRKEPCWLSKAEAPAKGSDQSILGPPRVVVIGGKEFRLRELLVEANSAKILEALGGLEQARMEQRDLDQFLGTTDQGRRYLCFIGKEAVRVDPSVKDGPDLMDFSLEDSHKHGDVSHVLSLH